MKELWSTTLTRYNQESIQPVFYCATTDRLGVRVYGITTAAVTKTITTTIGDGNASYLTTPLNIRHEQLRGKNDEEAFQHINAADRTKINNLSGTNTGDQNAIVIPITDIGLYFDSTNVENALQEIGLYMQNIVSDTYISTDIYKWEIVIANGVPSIKITKIV